MSGPSAEKDVTHDRGLSWPTVATVDLMLRQLRRDRATAYWGEPPHAESLDGAEAWLLSLRDWLESTPAKPPPPGPGATSRIVTEVEITHLLPPGGGA